MMILVIPLTGVVVTMISVVIVVDRLVMVALTFSFATIVNAERNKCAVASVVSPS